jgi:type IV secretion system protein VirB2
MIRKERNSSMLQAPASSWPVYPRAWRTRATQFVIVASLLAIATATAQSGSFGLGGLGGLGGGMPWEGPLQQLLTSLTGPVSQVIGAVAIIGLGVGIAFSEGGSIMRKALWVVLGLAIAFNAVSWGLGFLGFSGGLLV